MAKFLNFYDEISSVFGRVIKKDDVESLTDEQFLNLSSEKRLRMRDLLNELMVDRNKLFPTGFGADSVDVAAMPDIELPRWSSLVSQSADEGTYSALLPPRVELSVEESAVGVPHPYGGEARIGHRILRQVPAEYGADTSYFVAYANKLLQEGNRLFSSHSKRRLHARIVNRKKAAFIKELHVFQTQVGPGFDKLNPELAAALKALIEQSAGRGRP
jgi:hypothetical protein